jgi:beta-galactosidase
MLYHGAAYYPELWPEEAIDGDIARMRELGINVVRMGEFAWGTMEPEEGKISLAFFKRVMDKLHAAGISTVFCTPTPTPPIWLTHGHPDRLFVDANGTRMSHGARQHVSYDNPAVQAACWRIVEALGRELGSHPGLVAWQIDNELKCHVAEDYNEHSIRRWHEWLKKRYGSIDRLNTAWGAEIWSEKYQKFEQVPAPVKTPFAHNASLTTAFLMFSREAIAEFLDRQVEILRAHSRAPITHNMSLGFSVNFERLCQNLDFASFDAYPASAQVNAILLDCDTFRTAKPGKPFWVMETSAAHNGWLKDYQPAHPPGFLVAEAMACYGLGAEAFCYWLWRQQRAGCELPHSAIVSAWNQPTIGFESVRDVEAARKRLEPLLTSTRPATAEVAVTWSDRGRAFLQTEPLGGNRTYSVDHYGMVSAWHALLLGAGYHRDVRFEGAALDGLKVLVTPAMPFLSEAFLARVEKWVRAGGTWIAGPLTGTRTGEHAVHTDAALGALEKLAGVQAVFSFPVTGTDADGEFEGIRAPLSGWCHALRSASGDTRAIGALHARNAPETAFLTERSLGSGKLVVLGAQPQGPAGEKLLLALVAKYAAPAEALRFEVSPGTLVCPRVTAEGRRLWLVVNLDGKGGRVVLPGSAQDAFTGHPLGGSELSVSPYGHRAVWIA